MKRDNLETVYSLRDMIVHLDCYSTIQMYPKNIKCHKTVITKIGWLVVLENNLLHLEKYEVLQSLIFSKSCRWSTLEIFPISDPSHKTG